MIRQLIIDEIPTNVAPRLCRHLSTHCSISGGNLTIDEVKLLGVTIAYFEKL